MAENKEQYIIQTKVFEHHTKIILKTYDGDVLVEAEEENEKAALKSMLVALDQVTSFCRNRVSKDKEYIKKMSGGIIEIRNRLHNME